MPLSFLVDGQGCIAEARVGALAQGIGDLITILKGHIGFRAFSARKALLITKMSHPKWTKLGIPVIFVALFGLVYMKPSKDH
jgi:hypothetical protein